MKAPRRSMNARASGEPSKGRGAAARAGSVEVDVVVMLVPVFS
jgi:hypothetical protein